LSVYGGCLFGYSLPIIFTLYPFPARPAHVFVFDATRHRGEGIGQRAYVTKREVVMRLKAYFQIGRDIAGQDR
jgi:hypothetical protein